MRRILHLLLLLGLAVTMASCTEPDVDDTRPEGSAPEPTGVIEGTVLYIGPRPQCEYTGGVVERPIGRVILTLFEYDNPPPPSGGASSAENLLTIPGQQLFPDLDDCVPEGEEIDPFDESQYIMRSVAFIWPEIHLAEDHPVSYQIRGFYDYDEDMNPFFSVSNLPTYGDVVGGALVRVPEEGETSTFLPIDFLSQQDAPNGDINDSPTVTLGAVVNTERPVFYLQAASALGSEESIPLVADSLAREQMLFDLTETELTMFATNEEEPLRAELETALDAAGLDFTLGDRRAYAWYVREVDADGDGAGDLHPILGSAMVPWLTPIIIMQRAQTPAETAAGVPPVLIIGSVRPSQLISKQVFRPSIDFVVPPIAAVDLKPGDAACRIPYIPAGNALSTYERIPVMCQELPTGVYNVNVLQGLAGGEYQSDVLSLVSDTGFNIDGGQTSGQAWGVPNALGDPVQLGCPDPTDCDLPVASQGPAGRFVIHDPNPDSPIGIGSGTNGVPEGCQMAPDDSMPPDLPPTEIEFRPISDDCCTDAIKKLCGIPLCEATALDADAGIDAEGRMVRQGTDANGDGQLDCMPFLLPEVCCRP